MIASCEYCKKEIPFNTFIDGSFFTVTVPVEYGHKHDENRTFHICSEECLSKYGVWLKSMKGKIYYGNPD